MRLLKLQFGLRTLFSIFTLTALVFGFLNYWESLRPLREKLRTIRRLHADEQEQRLYSTLVWNDEQELCEYLGLNGLDREVLSNYMPHALDWQKTYATPSGTRRVFVLSSTEYVSCCSAIIVTDNSYQPICWIDLNCRGSFASAEFFDLFGTPQLVVETDNWSWLNSDPHRTKGIYRYWLRANDIEPLNVEWGQSESWIKTNERLESLQDEIEKARAELAKSSQ